MKTFSKKSGLDRLGSQLGRLWADPQDRILIKKAIAVLDSHYGLGPKIAAEPGVEAIVTQMAGRLANVYSSLAEAGRRRILDIACGSNTSMAPPRLHIDTPFGNVKIGRSSRVYTTQFEPWFCRLLLELGAYPVGIDSGDLEGETFEHHRVDLAKVGALSFLPDHSFDGIQDSRLFGLPEFMRQLPRAEDRLQVAQEIVHQERRLLKAGGRIIHSDAASLVT